MATTSNDTSSTPSRAFSESFYTTAWRWHFYAGLYVAPFLIVLSLTGLIMLWSSVFAGRDGERFYPVAPSPETAAVSIQVAAATDAVPGGVPVRYIAPRGAGEAAVFNVLADDQTIMVAVDPHRATVLGKWDSRSTLYHLANLIHSTLLIGTLGDRLIEIAAGLGVMLLATGLYMWWTGSDRASSTSPPPRPSGKTRALWKSVHKTVGVWSAALLLIFLISGLSWTGVWGEKITQAWSTFPAEKYDAIPVSTVSHASMNHAGVNDVPWALEQTPMPASDSHAAHKAQALPGGSEPSDLDKIVGQARSLGFAGRFQLSFPQGETGVWTIARDTMSNDAANPLSDRTVHIDRYTGKVLADIRFSDYSVLGKAMAIGVAFHEGHIVGGLNVALNTTVCLAVIFLSVSGVVMWWKRRPSGAGRLVAPTPADKTSVWKTGALVIAGISLVFPLTGLIFVFVLILDFAVIRRLQALKRVVS